MSKSKWAPIYLNTLLGKKSSNKLEKKLKNEKKIKLNVLILIKEELEENEKANKKQSKRTIELFLPPWLDTNASWLHFPSKSHAGHGMEWNFDSVSLLLPLFKGLSNNNAYDDNLKSNLSVLCFSVW